MVSGSKYLADKILDPKDIEKTQSELADLANFLENLQHFNPRKRNGLDHTEMRHFFNVLIELQNPETIPSSSLPSKVKDLILGILLPGNNKRKLIMATPELMQITENVESVLKHAKIDIEVLEKWKAEIIRILNFNIGEHELIIQIENDKGDDREPRRIEGREIRIKKAKAKIEQIRNLDLESIVKKYQPS